MGLPTLTAAMAASLSDHGQKTALIFLRRGMPETTLTYGDLDHDANRCARAFRRLGVTKGDRVALFLNKSVFAVVVHLALYRIGAIAVPLNPGFKEAEMDYLLGDADPMLILSEPEKRAMLSSIAPHRRLELVDTRKPYEELDFFRSTPADAVDSSIAPQDPALIIYTSGTTGNPKGAVLTQQNLVYDGQNVIKVWEIDTADRLCHALPLFHVHGLCFALHTCLLAGAGVILLDRFEAGTVLDVLTGKAEGLACTLFMAVPAMYTKLMDAMPDRLLDFSHIRLWTSGSAPLPDKDFARIERLFGKAPVEREGMSETGMNFSNPLPGPRIPGSIGIPLPGLQVRVVDPDNLADVDPGDIGELWLKSPAITPGYWRKPRETADTFVEGWFRSGDLGRVDPEGYYYLTDRIKHIIISGGENVSAKEVETVINLVDDVMESAVVGLPHEKWGEQVAAAVVTKPGSTLRAEQIQAFCRRQLHDWKCPRKIRFTTEIPRNTMGKVLKEEVKKLLQD